MKFFKRKDGTIFGKANPTKKQLEEYKKAGHQAVDESGNAIKKTVKKQAKK